MKAALLIGLEILAAVLITVAMLALIAALSGCGDTTPPAPPDMKQLPDLTEPYVEPDGGGIGNPGTAAPYDPCKYAICNNPDKRSAYTDTAPEYQERGE